MPAINLIANRRAEKKRQRRNVRKLTYITMGEIGVALMLVSYMSVRIVEANHHVADLNDQIRKLEPRVSEIAELKQDTDRLLPKVHILASAKAETMFWYTNLFALTNSLPEKTWLTALSTGGTALQAAAAPNAAPSAAPAQTPTLTITGVTVDQSSVGEAMLRMNQEKGLDHVDLSFVQQQKIGKIDTTAFQMTVHLKPETEPNATGGPDAKSS